VQFINAVERDRQFFVINGINLTGQQTGQVNLRMHLTTYLRGPNAAEQNNESALPEAQEPKSASPASKTAGLPKPPMPTGAKR
jgi:type IV pilus assembly protein PilO